MTGVQTCALPISLFDETHYAELVANKFNTHHTTFSLTNDDLLNDLEDIVNYIDEPFADSSAIPTYILSKHTSKQIGRASCRERV